MASADRSTARFGEPRAAGLRVLFIEDDDCVRYATTQLLELKGVRADPVPDGETGLTHARSGEYDVILLDLVLPTLSGLEVLRQLRRESIWTPVVILTGRGDFESALEAGSLGVSAYLRKPPLLETLLNALDTAARCHTRTARPVFLGDHQRPSPTASVLLQCLCQSAAIDRGALTRLLATGCTHDLTFVEFVAVARSLRSVTAAPALPLCVASIQEWLRSAMGRPPLTAVVLQALARIEAAGKSWPQLSEKAIAQDLGLGSTEVWMHTGQELGLTFVRCRRAVLMRQAACHLANGHEHVRQIAFRLGYADAGNFDRDFRDVLGVTPTSFRRCQLL